MCAEGPKAAWGLNNGKKEALDACARVHAHLLSLLAPFVRFFCVRSLHRGHGDQEGGGGGKGRGVQASGMRIQVGTEPG